ncbi:hypothetical protein, partial [Microbacterium awajiense]|uniref:hypothetical protein n=1 Tax=Microbacterium awajiense TaxID=415214 RepID=UPI0031E43AF2
MRCPSSPPGLDKGLTSVRNRPVRSGCAGERRSVTAGTKNKPRTAAKDTPVDETKTTAAEDSGAKGAA